MYYLVFDSLQYRTFSFSMYQKDLEIKEKNLLYFLLYEDTVHETPRRQYVIRF